ncbi:hypothetical protein [Sphingobium sp. KCTC 72723]|uniref:hypothetical protein n=1 Tax=Sphingobium sp. KCTC 72723 TaxID=2733867 RepID=UPI00165E9815|nr:hypothetical protein [Sphingobium sp. KCTC 72723]
MTFPCPSSRLAAILAASLLASQAQAQDYRPDAEGYPCAARSQLAIVQDDQGYSIRLRQVAGQAAKPVVATAIPIGAAFKIDARIFALSTQASGEASSASRR